MEREPKESIPHKRYFIRLRSEGNVTPAEITQIILVIRRIYTALWLLDQNRHSDLITYSTTWNPKFEEETDLQIKQPDETLNGNIPSLSIIELNTPKDHNPEVIKKVFGILETASQRELEASNLPTFPPIIENDPFRDFIGQCDALTSSSAPPIM